MSPPFFWGHSGQDLHQHVTMVELSTSNSMPDHGGASRGLTDIMWNSMHIIEAVVHFMVFVVKVVTAPIWWPIAKLKQLGKSNSRDRKSSQAQDPYTTDLNRPLYK